MAPSRKLRLLFVADPLEHFDPASETSLYMMREAQRRGHYIYHTQPKLLSSRKTDVKAWCQRVQIKKNKQAWYKTSRPESRALIKFDAILLRKDPPFDQAYLHHLFLLELISEDVYFMNHPSGILVGNEKIFPLPFKEHVPDTLISARKEQLLDFIKKHRDGVILKPLGEAGGRGIFKINSLKAENLMALLDQATRGFSQYTLAQAYLPEAKRGDKRVLLLGPKILGAFKRKPAPGEHRANLHMGGTAAPVKVNRKDQEIIDQLRPSLLRLGLDFVGLDLIGDKLIEVNVTSPMGIHELNTTQGLQSEREVIDYLEMQTQVRR